MLNPRDAILPADRSTSRRLPVRLGRACTTAGCSTTGCCTSRTGCARPRTGRGSGGCTGRRSPSPRSDCSAIFYRRGVASSLTQIGDVRQLDFIRAFDQVLAETAQDRDADRLLPKAVRTYCAIISHHLGSIERFEPAVAQETALDERGRAAPHAAGRAGRGPRLDGRRTRHPAAPAAPPPRPRRGPPPDAPRRSSWPPRCTARPPWPPRIDSGLLPRPPAGGILLISNNATTPETTPGARRDAGLRARCAAASTRCSPGTRPSRPSTPAAGPRAPDDVPLWERHLRAAVGPRRRPRRAGRGVHPGPRRRSRCRPALPGRGASTSTRTG